MNSPARWPRISPFRRILDHLITRTVEMLPITAAGVTLITPGEHPRYIGASDASALLYEKLQTELGEGPCILAYTTGEAVEVPELLDEQRFPKFTPRALAEGMRAVFTFPLRHGDHQLGALDLYRDTPGSLSPQALATSQTLADVATAYLINAQARDELKDSSKRSRELALHDALTGLPNRTLLLELLDHALQRSHRTEKSTAVLFLDLDGFKTVNDTYGHGVGDQLLVAVARRLSHLLRPSDTMARLHGDEFVILCEDLDTPDQADDIVDPAPHCHAVPFALATAQIEMTVSIGHRLRRSPPPRPETGAPRRGHRHVRGETPRRRRAAGVRPPRRPSPRTAKGCSGTCTTPSAAGSCTPSTNRS